MISVLLKREYFLFICTRKPFCNTSLSFYTEIILFKKFLQPALACVKFQFLSRFLVPSTGTFHLTSHNQNSTFYLSIKKCFLLPLEILFFAHKKLTGDHYFVEKDLSFLVLDATFTPTFWPQCDTIFVLLLIKSSVSLDSKQSQSLTFIHFQ
jgi:hypothetical protein